MAVGEPGFSLPELAWTNFDEDPLSDIVIKVEGLSKQYRIGARQSYGSFRETVREMATKPLNLVRGAFGSNNGGSEDVPLIWALKDVSFNVCAGEILGLVGRNGAGKSTLLKVLSRITSPTEGKATIRGRVRSLLEVGTGFHQELTGRENIYLNGAILGMKKTEIESKFDEIVEFAGVGQFIDTPVKRYSSGMYLRLAFSVAAHLVSEILFVDEVLAVGDAAFQKKCVGRMNEVAKEGRTVLFVSHNLAAVRTLCTRGILLEQGRVADSGDIEHVLYRYTQSQAQVPQDTSATQTRFTSILVNGENPGIVESGDTFEVSCALQVADAYPRVRLFCVIQDTDGEELVVAPCSKELLAKINHPGLHQLRICIPALWLRPGVYSIYFKFLVASAGMGSARFLSDTIMLDVRGSDDPEMLMGCLSPVSAWEYQSSMTEEPLLRS
jgi:lipopolysaccharide transport system ATP-binding protein